MVAIPADIAPAMAPVEPEPGPTIIGLPEPDFFLD